MREDEGLIGVSRTVEQGDDPESEETEVGVTEGSE